MKAWQDDSGNLIVINVLMFVRALLVAFGVGMVAAWIAPIPSRQSLGWSAVCVVFVLALLTADERSTFVFERRTGILRWRQDTPFRHDRDHRTLSRARFPLPRCFERESGRADDGASGP
jgi:hypothetical protein